MGIGVTASIFDKDGKPATLSSGHWFCYGCKKLRKTIIFPHTSTINCACEKCGATVVFQQD